MSTTESNKSYFQCIKSHRTHGGATTIIRVEDLMTKKDTKYPEDPACNVRERTQDPVSTKAGNSWCTCIWEFCNYGKTRFSKHNRTKPQKVPYEPTGRSECGRGCDGGTQAGI